MMILAIETSCDETSAAVVEGQPNSNVQVLSNVTASSILIHSKTGGIIPENAAREQVKSIIPVIVESLILSVGAKSNDWSSNFTRAQKILKANINSIAITVGPGLIGSLLVGVETVKTLSFVLDKPLIPVNHLLGHLYANFISEEKLSSKRYTPNTIPFPFIGLIVSGGHTDLLHFKSHKDYKWLGGTRDDAAGEALDKIGRLLDISYPAGEEIERRAAKVKKTNIKFKSPLINSDDFDFSFSGLKSEVYRFVNDNKITPNLKNEICFATQKAIVDVLTKKTIKASQKYNVSNILLGGGVAANRALAQQLEHSILNSQPSITLFIPKKEYCTDNAAMIGAYAIVNGKKMAWQKIIANPELYFN